MIFDIVSDCKISSVNQQNSQYYLIQKFQILAKKMNGRRSLDPSSSKPFNINIYYNINSRNITNNNEVQSHPVSARVSKNTNDQFAIMKKGDAKGKGSGKVRKKKYSIDLGMPTDKKTEKVGKKSNSNSICSGFPSQANQKVEQRDHEKSDGARKLQNTNSNNMEKNQQKLCNLLQFFTQGKIDKSKLTKQIINMFQLPQRREEPKQKKINKKKRSVTTLLGTITPRNQTQNKLHYANPSVKTVLNIHKQRKKQSKSEKSHFQPLKNFINKEQITERIIQCRAIDSSLFLNPDDDENILPFVDKNDIQTSYSIMLLNENLKKQRKNYKIQERYNNENDVQNLMALKIQRAWRKYKTRKLIAKILKPLQQLNTEKNSAMEEIINLSSRGSLSVENFLSLELDGRSKIKEAEIARVQQLKDHQLKKWNEVMDYVKLSINNKELTPDQCLKQIISYFEKAKRNVEKQLFLDKFKLLNNQTIMEQERSRQITEFTNGIYSRQIKKIEEKYIRYSEDEEQILSHRNNEENHNKDEEDQDEEEGQRIFQQDQEGGFKQGLKEEQYINEESSKISIHTQSDHLLNQLKRSQNLSFEVVQSTLVLYSKKLDKLHNEQIRNLDINSKNYFEQKGKLEADYRKCKKQIRRIITNLNKGYHQAKNILQKNALFSIDQNLKNSRQALQKCKSDNYLLKTAMNYKKYIQKKQRNEKNDQFKSSETSSIPNSSPDSKNNIIIRKSIFVNPGIQQNIDLKLDLKTREKKLTKVKLQDNLEYHSIESQEEEQSQDNFAVGQGLKKVIKAQLNCEQNELIDNKSIPFEIQEIDGGEGEISNKGRVKYNKLEEKIISQEFLQYEQIKQKLNDEESSSIKQIDNAQSISCAQQISLFQNTKLNEMNRKFKYLTVEEKEDIFQFIFIDMSLQISTDYDPDSKLYQTIRRFIQKRKKLDSIPKGVKTSLNSCKQYLGLIHKAVMTQFTQVYLKHIVVPMGPTARQMLKYMREQEQSVDQQNQQPKNNLNQSYQQDQSLNVPLILPVGVFENLQYKLVANYPRYYEDDQKQHSRIKFLKSVDHIHHKAIFDSLNEALDIQRPFGIWGSPFPWKTSSKILKKSDWQKQKRVKKLKQGVERVIQNCSYMCGILSDKQQSLFGQHKVSQNYVDQIRQDRMSKMLANELAQSQDRWAFYDDQQTQVLIQLTRAITQKIINEFSSELSKIMKDNKLE